MNDGSSEKAPRKRQGSRYKVNPRRGGPGVLLTCETGRESKCRREGLDILRHYLSIQNETTKASQSKSFTLDEEISLLQEGASSEQVLSDGSRSFQVFETGCRGTQLVMCTIPNCTLIPPSRPDRNESVEAKRRTSSQPEINNAPRKKARLAEQDETASAGRHKDGEAEGPKQTMIDDTDGAVSHTNTFPPWDPLVTVQRVISDLESASATAPSSRFVTRMIPIQATCFVSPEEIGLTAKGLIEKFLSKKVPSTFSISVKKRNCSVLSRDQVIDTVAKEMIAMEGSSSKWKVDLKSPAFTIHVEICKNVCGMSIIEDSASYRNFNLVEIREAGQVSN